MDFKEVRLHWDEYFMRIARIVASRSTCIRRKVGAVAVDPHHRILGTGYNGAPSGMEHCTKETCIRTQRNIPSGTQLDLCKAIHAEANIVLQLGEKLNDATLYCTTQPCTSCLKLLMGARIYRVVWMAPYDDDYSRSLMQEYGIVRAGSLRVWTADAPMPPNCQSYGLWDQGGQVEEAPIVEMIRKHPPVAQDPYKVVHM